jgi:putative hemolysin
VLLIIANGIFAMSEIAIVSSRRARLKQLADEGHAGAEAALKLSEHPTRFLSTVQIGITLVGIFAGAFGGATLAKPIADSLRTIPALEIYADGIGLFLVSLAIAYLSLVIGELVPKRLGLNNPERIASAVAGPMSVLSVVASPVVKLLTLSTEVILRLLGLKPSDAPPVTEEEIKIMMEQGAEAGVFQEAEQDMIENVFRLDERRISTIMTPRPDIVWLDVDDPPEENRQKIIESEHSYFPVYQETQDNVLGVVSVKNLWARIDEGRMPDLRACLSKPPFVPESMPALKVLEQMRQSGMRMALVINEYGSVEGLVTLIDIMQAIVGDMPEHDELNDVWAVQREDGSWLMDGLLDIHDLKEMLDIKELPAEERGTYQTLGGFVMMQLGRIPNPADHFEWDGFRFEVMDMDGRRVDKVLVVPPAKETPVATDEESR